MAAQDSRPYFLNLLKIRLPIPGIVSIFHRVSGVFLFVAIPLFVYLLDLSLQGHSGFHRAEVFLDLSWVKFFMLIVIWSLVHHLYAGIRFLLTDFDIGLSKQQSINTAWLVIIAEVISLILIFVGICL